LQIANREEGKAMNRTLFILGGTGFIGHETIIQALKVGWQVKAQTIWNLMLMG
jgi:hypothetical protein